MEEKEDATTADSDEDLLLQFVASQIQPQLILLQNFVAMLAMGGFSLVFYSCWNTGEQNNFKAIQCRWLGI
jgi:hypothetical protein